MTTAVQRLLSKGLALAILVAAVLLAFMLVVEPLMTRSTELQEQIEAERALLGRMRSAPPPGSKTGTPATKVAGDIGEIFLPGASDPLRLAFLQSRLGKVANDEGAILKSVRNLPGREREGLRLLGVEAQMTASIGQLQRILFALETDQPHLFVETIQITPPPLLSQGNPDAGQNLEVRLGLFGAATGKKS
jgi:hypothetical protein